MNRSFLLKEFPYTFEQRAVQWLEFKNPENPTEGSLENQSGHTDEKLETMSVCGCGCVSFIELDKC